MRSLNCDLIDQLTLLLLLFLDFSSPSFFKCPPYNYQQNNEVITFIIDVPDIALDSVSLGFRKNKVSSYYAYYVWEIKKCCVQ